MIKGFSVKNMLIGVLIGALVGTNFHVSNLSAGDMAAWISVLSVASWAAVEALEIKWREVMA